MGEGLTLLSWKAQPHSNAPNWLLVMWAVKDHLQDGVSPGNSLSLAPATPCLPSGAALGFWDRAHPAQTAGQGPQTSGARRGPYP